MKFIVFCLMLCSLTVQAAVIENIRIWPEPTKVRVVLDLSAGTEFKQFMLENPDRLVIDLPAGKFSADMSKVTWPMPINSMRHAQHDA
ncbi:MAG: AMIN domain-containing protein, partial [Legionellales bacterium]